MFRNYFFFLVHFSSKITLLLYVSNKQALEAFECDISSKWLCLDLSVYWQFRNRDLDSLVKSFVNASLILLIQLIFSRKLQLEGLHFPVSLDLKSLFFFQKSTKVFLKN